MMTLSPSAEKNEAWSAAMYNIATAHADERVQKFRIAMQEFIALPSENRPLVSPSGVIIAEMIALISILRAQVNECKESAYRHESLEAAEMFNQVEMQTEIAAMAIRNIDIL